MLGQMGAMQKDYKVIVRQLSRDEQLKVNNNNNSSSNVHSSESQMNHQSSVMSEMAPAPAAINNTYQQQPAATNTTSTDQMPQQQLIHQLHQEMTQHSQHQNNQADDAAMMVIQPLISTEQLQDDQDHDNLKQNGRANNHANLDNTMNCASSDIGQLVMQAPNIHITVKNTHTLDEYECTCHVDLDYLPKLQKWLSKEKYQCEENLHDMNLQIQIFQFQLQKSSKTDHELIREELSELKKEKLQLVRDFKLFHHYFFSFWKEKARDGLQDRPYLIDTIVESPQNLYNQCEGQAFVDEEDFSTYKHAYIGFKQPLAFLYHTGAQASRQEEQHMVRNRFAGGYNNFNQGSYANSNNSASGGYGSAGSNQQKGVNDFCKEEWFEVFICGKGYPHNLAQISSKTVKEITVNAHSENSMVYYLHRINLNLHKSTKYTVYTPKIFA